MEDKSSRQVTTDNAMPQHLQPLFLILDKLDRLASIPKPQETPTETVDEAIVKKLRQTRSNLDNILQVREKQDFLDNVLPAQKEQDFNEILKETCLTLDNVHSAYSKHADHKKPTAKNNANPETLNVDEIDNLFPNIFPK
jgi:hypothetical protein